MTPRTGIRDLRTGHLLTGIGVSAVALQLGLHQHGRPPLLATSWTWWEFALAFCVAEICVVHVQFGPQAQSFGLSEIPLVIAMFTLAPDQVVLARLIGGGTALLLVRHQRHEKLVFNLAQWWLCTLVVLLVWRPFSTPGSGTGPVSWFGAAVAVAVAELLGTLLIAAAIRAREGGLPGALLPRGLLQAQLVGLANVSFGLIALDLLTTQWRTGWTLVVLAAVVYVATRAHTRLHERMVQLSRLNASTAGLGRTLELTDTVDEVLGAARDLLSAQASVLVLRGDPATGSTRTFVRDEHGTRELANGHHLEGDSGRHVQSCPLEGPDGAFGLLRVTGHLSEVGAFSSADATLLETLGRHAGAALYNSRLAALLREQAAASERRALHDPLTGLPNRVLFAREVDEACATGDAAVLLLDLDRFKEVNDTLGHAAGDELLREVAERLGRLPGDVRCVCRLGGDEFGVLLDADGVGDASAHAERIRAELLVPLAMSGISFRIEASIGIALAPQHGRDSESLLRCADVAMYFAKSTRTPVQVYSARCDLNSAARLALVSDLRWALLNDQFRLQYQPKVNIAEGRVHSLEALIRWHDPDRGVVGPDAFIPVAEQVGLIGDLTDWVLATSLAQCRRWDAQGVLVNIAVNVSAVTLHDPDFAAGLRAQLERAGIAPHRLTLEITEGAVMRDPSHALRVLHELRAMGVRLSIDDLGAGQSSLTYLRQLPVHEVKIDKSFVMGMSEVADDDAIVTALVNLVHTLRLPVVAEGVENEKTWLRLSQIGCDTAQGYWLSRPLDPDQVPGWLGSRHAYVDLVQAGRIRPRLRIATTGTAP